MPEEAQQSANDAEFNPLIAHAVAIMELDRFTASIIVDLESAGVEPILLKGPSFATWLYENRTDRTYGDADIYVGPDQWERAVSVLEGLGLVDRRAGEDSAEKSAHATALSVPGGWTVDLHRFIAGCEADERTQWSLFSQHSEGLPLCGHEATVLDETARALHVALHAAQHGRSEQKPLDDLARAVARVDDAGWLRVADLASKLGASAALATGLRLDAGGLVVADRLELTDRIPAHIRLRAEGGGGARAMNVAKIAAAPTLGMKLRYLWRWVFPSRTKMERLAPQAGSGRRQLMREYIRHLRRSPQAIDAVREWRRARRGSAPRN